MNVYRKILFKSVRERVLVAQRGVRQCPQCGGRSMMVTAAIAATISQYSIRSICHFVDAEQIHYCDGPDGLFVCLGSLDRIER